jgi:hypothetical protein
MVHTNPVGRAEPAGFYGDKEAGVAIRIAGSVRGLGVCDVLRAELAPVQRDELVTQLAARIVAGSPDAHALAQLSASVPAAPEGSFELVGPADLVLELVDACLRVALDRACAGVASRPVGAVARDLEAAGAWIETALDCGAVQGFCFEPGVDPARVGG